MQGGEIRTSQGCGLWGVDQQGNSYQVWQLTQLLFCWLLVKKIDLPGGQIFILQQGNYSSLPFLPANPYSQSQTHEGLLELKWLPSRALNVTSQDAFGTKIT